MFNRDNFMLGTIIFLVIALFFTSIDYLTVQNSPPATGMAGGGVCEDKPWEYCSEPLQLCDNSGGILYTVGGACSDQEVCCRINAYCGDRIVDSPEQCDINVGIPTCVSLGYYSGTVTCTSACTENVTGCTNCGNGVCNVGETCSSCVEDCNGTQADCSAGQVCELGECIAEAPSICNDTTSIDSCSSVTGAPWLCNADATLVQNCTACGCPAGSNCDAGGSCISPTPSLSYSGRTYSVAQATPITSGSGGTLIRTLDATVSGVQLSWGGIRTRDKINFEITKTEDSSNGQTETHSIEVNRISRARKFVEITISSDPIEVVLYEGEPQRVDVDGDGIEDVVILATNIELGDFDIDIQEIDKDKLAQEDIEDDIITKIRERKVFFPEPLLSPVFEESPEANLYEFIIVNAIIILTMIFFFFKFTKEIRKL